MSPFPCRLKRLAFNIQYFVTFLFDHVLNVASLWVLVFFRSIVRLTHLREISQTDHNNESVFNLYSLLSTSPIILKTIEIEINRVSLLSDGSCVHYETCTEQTHTHTLCNNAKKRSQYFSLKFNKAHKQIIAHWILNGWHTESKLIWLQIENIANPKQTDITHTDTDVNAPPNAMASLNLSFIYFDSI